MLKGIDHLVVLVSDLDAAGQDFAALGFHVVPGGKHGSGTQNMLIPLADGCYIELIAFHEENTQHRWWHWLESGGGLIDYCMITDDLDADRAAFASAGVAIGAPYPLTRIRPDGFKLDWVIAVPEEPRASGAPFLIRDHTPRAERVPAAPHHPNGATGVASLVVAVDDLEAVRRWTGAMAGVGLAQIDRPDLDASGLRMTAGPNVFDHLKPAGGKGELAQALAERGPGPYAISLSGVGAEVRFDPALTQGVRIGAAP